MYRKRYILFFYIRTKSKTVSVWILCDSFQTHAFANLIWMQNMRTTTYFTILLREEIHIFPKELGDWNLDSIEFESNNRKPHYNIIGWTKPYWLILKTSKQHRNNRHQPSEYCHCQFPAWVIYRALASWSNRDTWLCLVLATCCKSLSQCPSRFICEQ